VSTPRAARTLLRLRVQPSARATALRGRMADGTLKVAVAAPPEDGRANRALERWLAEWLQVAVRQVRVTRGMSARQKTVTIDGVDERTVTARIDAALERMQDGADDGE